MIAFVTGANGFVGRAVSRSFLEAGWRVIGAVRSEASRNKLVPGVEPAVTGSLEESRALREALEGVDVVVHLAARTHVLRDSAQGDADYEAVNHAGTRAVAEAAALAGVKRVVFTSSIKVLGEQTRRPFDDTCKPSPEDAYGRTKLMAEQVLAETLSPGTTDWCILRPPLVFGAGVRGNFARLLRLARVGSVVPLPLGGIDNRRSTIFVEHLASAIQVASVHQNARRETFVVADDPPTSTSDLLRSIGASMGSRVRLFHVPGELLRAAAAIAGRSAEVQRLLGSLEVDASRFRERTGWKPSIPFQEAIDRTVSATA